MSNRKYYSKNTIKSCKICRFSTEINGGEFVFCSKKGRRENRDCCAHFSYDILKRIPVRQRAIEHYSKEDMSIE